MTTVTHDRWSVADTAHAAHNAGLCVVPPKEDGSKRPDGQWKQYQTTRPTATQMGDWYSLATRSGVGLLCGAISGGLEMFEFEGRAVETGLFDKWVSACSAAGLDDLLDRVLEGYQEHTPSGGVHILWRCPDVAGNTKIARDRDGVVLIETRGEGGYTIIAPSGGTVHPTGKPWTLARGGFDTIPEITADERADLVDIARTFDDYQPDDIAEPPRPPLSTDKVPLDDVWAAVKEELAGYSSGGKWMDATVDDYCRRVTWGEVLTGWAEVGTRGGITYWRRPGKDADGSWSATTNAKGTDRLIVFSSSVPGFQPYDGVGRATSYSKFDAHAIIAHNGDRVAAARTLRGSGYGTPEAPTGPTAATLAPEDTDSADDALQDIYDLLAKPDEPYDWVIEHLVERCDRIIVTGGEGKGKSTLLRQFGIRAAAGIHPFTDDEIDPVRVLHVDLENSERQIRRKTRPLVDLANKDAELERQQMFVVPRPQGLNLFNPPDLAWLADQVDRHQPDILLIGPLYKMADGDPTEEGHAKAISGALDAIRVAYNCAVIIEAHSPHGQGKDRPIRPYGASLWLRWPEFGIGLTDGGQLLHWRGQRDERNWPAALKRSEEYGKGWPWLPENNGQQATWAKVKDCLLAAGRKLSYAEIAVDLGVSKSWVGQVVAANKAEYDALCRDFDEGA